MRVRDRWLEDRFRDPKTQAQVRFLMACCRFCAGLSLFIGFMVFLAILFGLF